jgi:hypothetical protein
MIDGEDDAHRPLPVVLRPVEDELLSSWLRGTRPAASAL